MLLCIPSSSACSETQGQSNHSLLGCLSRKAQTTGSVQELYAEKKKQNKELTQQLHFRVHTNIQVCTCLEYYVQSA